MKIMHERQITRTSADNTQITAYFEIKSIQNQVPYFSFIARSKNRVLEPLETAEMFPDFEKYLVWHFVSYQGPLNYKIAAQLAKENNLDGARYVARWYYAKLEDFTEEKLLARLPALMQKYFKDMSELFGTEIRP